MKGGLPHLCEVLAFTPHGLALAYDATDGRFPRAWRLELKGDGRSDAPWCPWETAIGAIVPYREASRISTSSRPSAPKRPAAINGARGTALERPMIAKGPRSFTKG